MEEKYIINGEEQIEKINDNINDKNKQYHFDVLPHPYFGDVENAKVLFLAKNPSYDQYEDKYDTKVYKDYRNGKGFGEINLSNEDDHYYTALKKANFAEPFDQENNLLFFNAWKWWNKKVIGYGAEAINPSKIAFINLCGYHSKSFNSRQYVPNSVINKIKWNDLKLIIYVWGKSEWEEYFRNNGINSDAPKIELNLYLKDETPTPGANVNSIEKILKEKNTPISRDGKYNFVILKNYFKIK